MAQSETVPYYSPIAEGGTALISTPYFHYLDGLRQRLDTTGQAIGSVALTSQTATIGATPIEVTQFAGLYRVTWYLRITRAAATSSSVTVQIGWTETGVPLTFSGPAMTGNTIQTVQSQTFLLRSDGAAPITYAVTYASTPAADAIYRLDVVLEAIG